MESQSPIIYRSTVLYQLVIRALYGRNFKARYQSVADEIPSGSSVVELCAGDCYLYRAYLKKKKVDYVALDISPHFVGMAQRRGIEARVCNLRADPIPAADCVVMQGSLYQFLPQVEPVIEKVIRAARHKAIIAESVQNLSDSRIGILAALSKKATRPASVGDEFAGHRFNPDSLLALFQRYDAFERAFAIQGGRDMVGVFRGG